jgi:hypothetical protein
MQVTRVELDDPRRAMEVMVLCNNLEGPVDIALWEYAEKQMLGDPQELFDNSQRLEEELFTSETKYMITHVTSNIFQGEHAFFLKGAPEIVLAMKGAGCYSLSFGFESGSKRILDFIKKDTTLEMAHKAVELVTRHGMEAHGFFILGFPTETEEEMEETIRFSLGLNLTRANYFPFHPLPVGDRREVPAQVMDKMLKIYNAYTLDRTGFVIRDKPETRGFISF